MLAVEKKITSKLLENISSEKMYKVGFPASLPSPPASCRAFGCQLCGSCRLSSTAGCSQVDDHLACAVAGITADANILINYARLAAQRYTLTYQVRCLRICA